MKHNFLTSLITLISCTPLFFTQNVAAENNQILLAANNPTFLQNKSQKQITLNDSKINLIDNYLETIITDLTIRKIDLQLNIFNAYHNDANKLHSLFLNKDSEFNNVDALKDYKHKLQNKLTNLNSSLTNANFMYIHNDFDTNKLLNTTNFSLQKDNSEIVPFLKNYQQILKNNQHIAETFEKEIQQRKRSEFDIHFTTLNELDNQIFLKKAAKLYFIEKLKQQPTMANFEELNSYLLRPIDVNNL